jgi:hypothetical protein
MEENKYTVIIPTLWKSERIFKLFVHLNKTDKVGEILLIDNAGLYQTFNVDDYYNNFKIQNKIKLIQPGENIYVNPAWNLGVKEAKYENIAILGDDINFDMKLFDIIDEETLNKGIIGMDSNNYHFTEFKDAPWLSLMYAGRPRPWGWGCIILFKKKNWLPIPESIKVWYGDDWIMHQNPTPKLVLHNFTIHTEMSTTADLKEFDEIKRQDKLNYIRNIYGD